MNNPDRSSSRVVDVFLLAGALLALFLLGLRTISHADIWLHLSAGRLARWVGPLTTDPFSFGLAPETGWRQITWLYDLMVFVLWRLGGAPLTIFVHAAAVTGAFLVLWPVARRYSQTIHQVAALVLCIPIVAPLLTARPLIFCLLFMGISLALLSRPRWYWSTGLLLLILQVIWANFHISFFLGVVFALVRALEVYTARKKPDEQVPDYSTLPKYFALAIVLAAGSLINPFGLGVWREALALLTRPEGSILLEWISPFQSDFMPLNLTVFTTTALALIAAVFIFRRDRLPLLLTTVAVISAYLMVRSNHLLEVCALLAFPFLCLGVATVCRLLPSQLTDKLAFVARGLLGLMVLLMLFLTITNRYYVHSGSASSFGLRVNTDVFPVAAVENLRQAPALPEKLVNLAQDGGYLLWQFPERKVFADPRGYLYGGLFFNRMARELTGYPDPQAKTNVIPEVDALLLNATWSGAKSAAFHYLNIKSWAIGYFDGTSLLLLRKTSENRPLLDDVGRQQQGIELIKKDFMQYQKALEQKFIRPAVPARLVGAASIYHTLARYEESLAIQELLTRGAPRMVGAWIHRGIAEIQLGRFNEGITSLEQAAKLAPAQPLPYLWMGVAYAKTDRADEARAMKEKARALNPLLTERFEGEKPAVGDQPGLTVPAY